MNKQFVYKAYFVFKGLCFVIVLSGFFIACNSVNQTERNIEINWQARNENNKPDTTYINDEDWKKKAQGMIENQIKARGISDDNVLKAIKNTPRHLFVPDEYRDRAYVDGPLPIGRGQTISQPYIVALMSSKLDLTGTEKVLEIGTGSGYQAAILSQLAKEVYSIEIVKSLAEESKELLKDLGYNNVEVKYGDGYKGWPEKGKFDRIIVTAAPEKIPETLIEQLKPGGKMVLPVGKYHQLLKLIEKSESGKIKEKNITGVRFVPMVYPEVNDFSDED